jgi:SAM-dependent methyltransferase
VCGIDHSELMLRRAKRLNAEGVGRGVVDLRLASVDELPEFDAPFDKILTVNATMFWSEPVARLAELSQLLRPGGLIAVVHQPRGPGAPMRPPRPRGGSSRRRLSERGSSKCGWRC